MSENQRVIFASNLTRYMNLRGIAQSDIVMELGVSASTVSDWVKGKKYPRVDAMQKLADYLGVLISDLTTDHESKSGDSATDPWAEREALRRDPDRRALLDLAEHGPSKDVRQVVALIDALRATNPDFYDGDDPA